MILPFFLGLFSQRSELLIHMLMTSEWLLLTVLLIIINVGNFERA
jgi:NADH:ubiquinone oxidoreductase subunit K